MDDLRDHGDETSAMRLAGEERDARLDGLEDRMTLVELDLEVRYGVMFAASTEERVRCLQAEVSELSATLRRSQVLLAEALRLLRRLAPPDVVVP